jgi:uncharacterized protein related to proFAR isomerase
MDMLGQEVRTPLVAELSAHRLFITGGGASTTVLQKVSSIHAVYIDVFVQPTVDLKSISLVLYAANGRIAKTQQIHAAVAAGVIHAVRWGGSLAFAGGTPTEGQAIGQYYDVIVETDNNAANGLIEAWTAARS